MDGADLPLRVAEPCKQRAHPVELQIARPRLPPLVVDAPVPEGKCFVVGHFQGSGVRIQGSAIVLLTPDPWLLTPDIIPAQACRLVPTASRSSLVEDRRGSAAAGPPAE